MKRIPSSTRNFRNGSFARVALTLTLALLLLPSVVGAQAKVRVAIWDFENHSERSYWFSSDLGLAVRNHIDSAFSEDPALSSKFSIIEREALEKVLQEQGLATSGALDQQTAAKVGKILGIKYILTGAIDKFVINTTKGGFRGIGGSYTTAEAGINMHFIDTTTAERLLSISADGAVKKGGGVFKGASLSRDAEWGIASEAIEKAALAVVEKFSDDKYLSQFSAGGVAGGTEGKIIKADGNRAWINMGSMSGLKVGDKFDIYSVGEALVDPDTGMVLGVDESKTGNGEVTDVQERFSVITFTGAAKAKDVVRRPK